MESDLGNVGVQREVHRYERVQAFADNEATWYAVFSCGHSRKLSAEPAVGSGQASAGRYMDCPECTRLEQAEGA